MKCRHGNHPGWCMECAHPGDLHRTDLEAQVTRLREENKRLILALETINQIAKDLQDPVRRAGPAVRSLRSDRLTEADAECEEPKRSCLGLSGLQGEGD